MNTPDLKYWLALARIPAFGAVRIAKLMRAFPTMERAFSASVTDLLEAGFDAKLANIFLQARTHVSPEEELERLERSGTSVITRKDPRYPARLAQLFDPPALLFYRGTFPTDDRTFVSVVGSRTPSDYGKRACEEIVGPLAASGAVIVSGLAYGIDAYAHDITLTQHGTTIAVLGCGVAHEDIYPSGNRHLASRIIANGGAVISEFPIGTPPLKAHFPLRNRIIAGLSQGTLVIEAAEKSGSLITARAALEAGRDVYAVPGPFYSPLSEGPNNLLKMGATPVTRAQDIMASAQGNKTTTSSTSYLPASETERRLLELFKTDPLHADELARATNLPTDIVGSTLTLMEMKGVLKHEGGRYYSRQK